MLTRIKLENFKCFKELDLKCAPLTLLTGINGTGKSSVFQALLLLRQIKETQSYEAKALVLDGPWISLGEPEAILFRSDRPIRYQLDWHDERDRYFHPFDVKFDMNPEQNRLESIDPDENLDLEEQLVEFLWGTHLSLLNEQFAYVNAERTGPRTSYPYSSETTRSLDLGYGGELTWNYLYHNQWQIFSDKDIRRIGGGAQTLIDEVNQWLHCICPGARIELDRIDVANLISAEFTFHSSGGQAPRSYRPANVGFGLSYTLPVIVALLMPIGSLCMIENPEAHLHPQGQTKMAELAARAAKAGMQVMVETHSDHFIDGIRIAVREGILSPDDVAIHYFERQGNESVVRSPVIDSDGRLSEWPAGFFDQHEMNAVRLLGPRRA